MENTVNKNVNIGALVSVNTGKINNSCSYTFGRINNKRLQLATKNTGEITCSFLADKGDVVDIYNASSAKVSETIKRTSDAKNLGFDMVKDWKYTGGNTCLEFITKNWNYTFKEKKGRNIIHIKDAKDYITFADKINNKDKYALSAYVMLDNDIDFKGRIIPEIAKDRECAFEGIFDGNGHMLWNAVIKEKNTSHSALFGYLKGALINLIVDVRVHGSASLAGLCGVNMGLISYCGAVVRLYIKGERTSVAGLVNTNEGTINKCYTVSETKYPILPIVPISIAAAAVIGFGILGTKTIQTVLNADRIYAAIEKDPNQEKLPDNKDLDADEGSLGDTTVANKMSFTLNEKVTISLVSRECDLVFENPSSSPNKIIIQLKVENKSGELITVATSKGIEPGFRLRKLSLGEAAADVLTGTEKEGYMVIIPYNAKTEDRAAIETVVPVKITFKD